MDFTLIAKKIKELRKNVGLSQKELAKGICTQAQISKIEKGVVFPYANTLYLISQKLGVDVNYFFDIGMTPRLDYVQEVNYQLKIARRNLDYEDIKEIVKAEENNPLFTQNKSNQQILMWHKGIYEYELDQDLEKAIETLSEAINLTHNKKQKIYTEKEIEILISIGVFYFNERLKKSEEVFKEIMENVEMLPHLYDHTIKTRVFYNYARVLTRLEQFTKSIQYCEKGIAWCIEKDTMFLLGELHYQIGYNFELQENYREALKYMKKALIVFELQKDDKYISIIKGKIEELNSK
ncbi:helix-turn-helix domain-containing protein [Bacillus seohaeanensis]|jgi:transcriptional regulator with XRE-family HTH domain|uniref:Helix-turn-helix domain-containing protein n=1 Tax=Bacillus seohaeanensis TaxID=284580 RepID=A0ABW5RXB1_9BACI